MTEAESAVSGTKKTGFRPPLFSELSVLTRERVKNAENPAEKERKPDKTVLHYQ
jgi:hypothetical protein